MPAIGAFGNDQFGLKEAFVQVGNILESQPAARLWAGKRYYRRQDIHINDFYYLDMSGYGAGVEDLNLGIGKLSVAYLAGARPDVTTQNGIYAKSNIDVRFYDVKAPGGTVGGWFNFARAKGGTTQTGTVIPTSKWIRLRDRPSALGMARWLPPVCGPIWKGSG